MHSVEGGRRLPGGSQRNGVCGTQLARHGWVLQGKLAVKQGWGVGEVMGHSCFGPWPG